MEEKYKKTVASDTASLTVRGNTFELPIYGGSTGPDVIDIRTLYRDTGMFTFDPGFTSTASCESAITYIDGDKGELLYRGYPIDQLAEKSDFLEVAYLLLNGELPNKQQDEEFKHAITYHTMVHEQLSKFFGGFRRDAHPMAIMCGVVGAMSAFYHDSTDINDPEQRKVASNRLIAKIPTIAAMTYKYSIGQPFVYPRNDLNYAENFLYMTFGVPSCEEYKVNPILANAMDKIFILHADHEQNASTSTCALPDHLVQIHLPVLRLVLLPFGVLLTAVQMKPALKCLVKLGLLTEFLNILIKLRIRTILSVLWDLGTAFIKTLIHVPKFFNRPPMKCLASLV